MKILFQTEDSWSSLIVRVLLGVVMFPHGAQKLFGWFGGGGFSGSLAFFTENMNMPWIVAFLVIIGESFGSVGLILGLLGRVSAFGIGCVMLGAILMVHGQNGFFMNWFGQQEGEGFEYHLLALGMCGALMVSGSGKWSVDRIIARKL